MHTCLHDSKSGKSIGLSELLARITQAVSQTFPAPVWVRAEVSEYNPRNNGHAYLMLVEHDEQGTEIAKVSARIWKSTHQSVNQKFMGIRIS